MRRKKYDRQKLQDSHYKWLKHLNFQCQFSGKTVGKEVRGDYQKYHFHHTSSGAYGRERPGYNYLLLSWWSHWFVHFLGGIFIPGKSVTIQNRRAKSLPLSLIWKYPNPAQRLFHAWCRMPQNAMRPFTLLVVAAVLCLMIREIASIILLTP